MVRRRQQDAKNGETDLASNGSGSELQNRPATAPKKVRSKSSSAKPTQMLHQSEDGPSFHTPQKTSVTVSPGRSASTRERKKSIKAKESEESLETNDEVMWVTLESFRLPENTPDTDEESPEPDGIISSQTKSQKRRRKRKKPLTLATAQRKKAAASAAKRSTISTSFSPSSALKPKRLSKKAKPVAEKSPVQSQLTISTTHKPTVPEPQPSPSTSTGSADHSSDTGLQINRLKVLKLGGDMEDAIQIIISYMGGRKELTMEEELKRREHEQSIEEGKLKDAKEALVKLGLKLQTYSNKLTIDQDDAEADGQSDDAMKEEVLRVNAGIDVLLAVGQKIESEKERLQVSRLELAMQRVDFEKQRCAASKAQ